MVYIKQKRKFNDAWAFILYVILYISCNSYLSLQYSKGVNKSQTDIGYSFVFTNLAGTLFFVLLNFLGFTFCAETYIKATVLIFPFIVLTVCFLSSLSGWPLVALFSPIVFWTFFSYFFWKRIPAVAKILNHAVKVINANLFSCLFGVILCTIFQTIQLYLLFSLDIGNDDSLSLTLILVFFSTTWSFMNFIYFFKVYISSLVAYHYIDYESNTTSVLRNSIINTIYALGSISLAGLLVALVKTLRFVVKMERERLNSGRDRDRNFLIDCLICMSIIFLPILEDIVRFANEFTMPYIAIHGDGYINSVKESWELLGENNNFALVGLNVIDYSLVFSSFGLILTLLATNLYLLDINGVQYISKAMLVKLVSLSLVFFIFYSTTMMIFSSSFLALNYLYIENPEVIDSVDPSVSESFKTCKGEI